MSVDHYENFPVASWLCPRSLRPAVRAVYAFARTADDLADEGTVPALERLAALAAYRADLAATCSRATPSSRWPRVFGPLADAVGAHALPEALLADLLDAFVKDVAQPRYADRAQLLDYCRRSANPVGRLMLHLYGIGDALAQRESDAICSALQLANFWQDLGRDVARGRLYVPLDDCARHGVDPQDLLARRDGPGVRRLVADLVQWTRALMQQGIGLPRRVGGSAGFELRLVVHGGLRVLDKIEAGGFAALVRRPTLGARDAPLLLWRALAMPGAAA